MYYAYEKPCYVATNVLDSMIEKSLPSRAEISDIYNLIDSGVSGIVLAAEAAIGKHPIDCVCIVKYMHEIYKASSRGILGSVKIEIGKGSSTAIKKWI